MKLTCLLLPFILFLSACSDESKKSFTIEQVNTKFTTKPLAKFGNKSPVFSITILYGNENPNNWIELENSNVHPMSKPVFDHPLSTLIPNFDYPCWYRIYTSNKSCLFNVYFLSEHKESTTHHYNIEVIEKLYRHLIKEPGVKIQKINLETLEVIKEHSPKKYEVFNYQPQKNA